MAALRAARGRELRIFFSRVVCCPAACAFTWHKWEANDGGVTAGIGVIGCTLDSLGSARRSARSNHRHRQMGADNGMKGRRGASLLK